MLRGNLSFPWGFSSEGEGVYCWCLEAMFVTAENQLPEQLNEL